VAFWAVKPSSMRRLWSVAMGLLHKGLELLLGQRDGVGQQLLDKSHALAEAVRPVLALLLFLLLDKPLFLVFKLLDFFLDA